MERLLVTQMVDERDLYEKRNREMILCKYAK